jgi:hypothetical protein
MSGADSAKGADHLVVAQALLSLILARIDTIDRD